MPRRTSTIVNRQTLINGGATSPTVEVYQRSNGRVRVWWYCFEQDGSKSETIATFTERDWGKAVARARTAAVEYF